MNWFDEYPHILEKEIEEIKSASSQFKVDEAAKKKGIIRIYFSYIHQDGLIDLIAIYPDEYPFFRPLIFAPNINLPRHQNPFEKNLCLLPRPSQYWKPEWSVIDLLKSQLTEVLKKGAIEEEEIISEDPDEQAEPFTEYIDKIRAIAVLFNTKINLNNIKEIEEGVYYGGEIEYKMQRSEDFKTYKILIKRIFNTDSENIGELDTDIPHLIQKHKGIWFRANIRVPNSPKELYNYILNNCAERIKKSVQQYSLIAINVPEEISPGKIGNGWLFLFKIGRSIKKKNRTIIETDYYFGTPNPYGLEDITSRIPLVRKLNDKKATIVGIGAIGSPVALEFARNGLGELDLIDYDFLNADNTVRWALGLEYIGQYKSSALKSFIESNYPYTLVNSLNFSIGEVRLFNNWDIDKISSTNKEEFLQFLNLTDLVFDASAEEGVSHWLSLKAAEQGIPFISIYATRGAWGGVVILQLPNKGKGCWMCFKYLLKEGKIKPPPEDKSGGIQPLGCGDPTFTGSSFDLSNISLAGVRLAIATLLMDEKESYKNLNYDIAVLSLVDDKKNPIPPKWDCYNLEIHPDCPYCNN